MDQSLLSLIVHVNWCSFSSVCFWVTTIFKSKKKTNVYGVYVYSKCITRMFEKKQNGFVGTSGAAKAPTENQLSGSKIIFTTLQLIENILIITFT